MCTDYDLWFLAQATTAVLFPCRNTFEMWSWECDQLQSFFVERHNTAIKIETLFSGLSENNVVFLLFLGTHIAKAFLHIHLLEIPHYPLQQRILPHKIHVNCLRRQPLVEKKHTRKTTNKKILKIGKAKEKIHLKHIPINPRWKTKTKLTLKEVKFAVIFSLLWMLFVKGLTIGTS